MQEVCALLSHVILGAERTVFEAREQCPFIVERFEAAWPIEFVLRNRVRVPLRYASKKRGRPSNAAAPSPGRMVDRGVQCPVQSDGDDVSSPCGGVHVGGSVSVSICCPFVRCWCMVDDFSL